MTRRTLSYFSYAIAFLMLLMLALQLIPSFHYTASSGEAESVSIIKYVITPYEYKDLDKAVKEVWPDFTTGNAMLAGALVPIFAIIGALYALRQRTIASAIFGTIWSFLSLILFLTNKFVKLGDLYIVELIVLVLTLALCIFLIIMYSRLPQAVDNDKAEVFDTDPRAAAKLKSIEHAIEKKDVRELLDYAVSTDKSIRLKAVDGLGKVGGEGAFNLLVPMLRNTDVECRSAAAKALGNLGDARALAFIYDRMEREEEESVKEILLNSMAQLHQARAD